MQFSTATVLSLLSALAVAAPSPRAEADVVSKAANVAQWTIEGFGRICNYPVMSQCGWGFTINTNDGTAKTPCSFSTFQDGSVTADHTPQKGATCGRFTVTSAWSDQFGPGNGFTTLSVIDYKASLIVFPAYTDNQLTTVPVKPDQSYPVQTF
ncbi:hypothetical protein GQ53DRAFT_669453 [Thozetella sp. PMI_491]|nr:hypothetical protein GQ53DRAFT_669453 [Thozetella sp. PMI_491]